MAKIFDMECCINKVVQLAKDNLNAQLVLIDTEKNDGTTSIQIDPTAYFFQSLNESEAAAFDAFVFYCTDDPITDGQGPFTSQVFNISLIVVLKETGENAAFLTRLLRYSRAMKEVIEKNFTTIPKAARLTVTSVAPASFTSLRGDATFRCAGVKVKVALA